VRSSFDDLALLNDKYLVGALNRGEPMRDGDYGPSLDEFFQCCLNASLYLRVERTGSFVKQKVGGLA
jgi:hypothetical protein